MHHEEEQMCNEDENAGKVVIVDDNNQWDMVNNKGSGSDQAQHESDGENTTEYRELPDGSSNNEEVYKIKVVEVE